LPVPSIERDGATIYYEEQGSGDPILLLAPGGLNSSIQFWGRMPLNPLEAFKDEFRVVAMDQRNAGRSRGPLEPGDAWSMYARDQLAVLDHLGIERAQVIGCCIGCTFILELIEQAPERIASGVLMQPIGHDQTNPGTFGPQTWEPWGQTLIEGGASFDAATVGRFGHALFDSDFVFAVDRDFVRTIQTPLLLLYGSDRAHPRGVSEELAALLPNVETVERWRDPDAAPAATERMREFLRAHRAVGAR
jgi:pimeloyl-ACP methyl ester carboxylesterase